MTTVAAKDPDTDKTYWIDLFEVFVLEAYRKTEFSAGDILRYPRDHGLYYVITRGGRTAGGYPQALPRAASEPFRDGSVELVSRHPDDVSPPAIQSITWTPTAPMAVAGQQEGTHRAAVRVSGGLAGQSYPLTGRIVPTSGDTRDITLTVPVAQQ